MNLEKVNIIREMIHQISYDHEFLEYKLTQLENKLVEFFLTDEEILKETEKLKIAHEFRVKMEALEQKS